MLIKKFIILFATLSLVPFFNAYSVDSDTLNIEMKGIDFDTKWIPGFGDWVNENIEQVKNIGVSWIQFKPTWWMENSTSTTIEPLPDTWSPGQAGITISDNELVDLITLCHSKGLKFFLSPTVSIQTYDWIGNINPSITDTWFSNYENFIIHYAEIAANNNVELFCIGNDIRSMEIYEDKWRDIISKVKNIYNGSLTYSSGGVIFNQNNLSFWDELDYIGIWFFKPGSETNNPSIEQMKTSFQNSIENEIKPVKELYNKNVILTGVGCYNVDGANQHPWYFDQQSAQIDNEEQADYYKAIFESIKDYQWFSGIFWSRWELKGDVNYFQEDVPFTLSAKWKPAEHIITNWYNGLKTNKPKSAILIETQDSNGNLVDFNGFYEKTKYVADVTEKWVMYDNFGVFYLNDPPYSQQIGTKAFSYTQNQNSLPLFIVPSDTALYFTCLWEAPNIGTVFMEANNNALGFLLAPNQILPLDLAFEFCSTEYQTAQDIYLKYLSQGYSFRQGIIDSLNLAKEYYEDALQENDSSLKSQKSYESLSYSMITKEKIIVDVCRQNISKTGFRENFVFSYLGVGSWIDSRWDYIYNQAKDAGFKYVFTHCNWKEISPSQGNYDFSQLDIVLQRAENLGFKVALNIMHSIDQMPNWCQNLSFEELKQTYYQNVFEVVSRYKNSVPIMFAVGENTLGTTGYSIAEIVELTRQAFSAARAAAPDKEFGIFLNASAYVSYEINRPENANFISSWDFVNYMADNGIYADFVGLQFQYATIFTPIDLYRLYKILEDYHNVLNVPTNIAEVTYSSKTEDYGIGSNYYWHNGLDQDTQNDWAKAIFTIGYGTDFINYISWTHLDPDNNDWGDPFLSSLIGSNLIKSDSSAKKAYYTIKELIETWNNLSSVDDSFDNEKLKFDLHQNYPNPFNSETIILYQIPKSTNVTLKIYNTLGQEVITLENEIKEAGSHKIHWDGKNNLGNNVSSGLYFVSFETSKFKKVNKLLLIR